uniref:Uncharacterized protein n=1 Tax=Callorhinchus milii TaxID=7868 RepID=A0A4W3I257_CALMI
VSLTLSLSLSLSIFLVLSLSADKPLTFYVAVQSPVPVTRIVQQILGNVTGTVTNLTQENCTNGDQTLKGSYSYFWIDGDANKTESHCVQAYVWLTKAQSPAFHLKDYTSRAFSTWTESRWKDISARIYLVSSKQLEVPLSLSLSISLSRSLHPPASPKPLPQSLSFCASFC